MTLPGLQVEFFGFGLKRAACGYHMPFAWTNDQAILT